MDIYFCTEINPYVPKYFEIKLNKAAISKLPTPKTN